MIVAMVLIAALLVLTLCLIGAGLCWQISERHSFGKKVRAKEEAQAQRMPTSFNVVPDTSQLPSLFDPGGSAQFTGSNNYYLVTPEETIIPSVPYTDDHATHQAETTSQSDFDAISDGGYDGGDCGGCDGGDD